MVVMQEKETARTEAFSDGVFAIAITLLVLEIKVPHLHENSGEKWALLREIGGLWPSFMAFVLSFSAILIMWINHHGLFRHARRVDKKLLFANGLLLMLITFVPFPTAVLAEYLDRPGANAAMVFYCGTYVLINIAYNLLLRAVDGSGQGARSAPEEQDLARIRKAYHIAFVVYTLATLFAIFNAIAGLVINQSLWLMWGLLRYSKDRQPAH